MEEVHHDTGIALLNAQHTAQIGSALLRFYSVVGAHMAASVGDVDDFDR